MSAADILDRLIAKELQEHLGNLTIGREIIVLEETGSTNDSLFEKASPNTPEGLVVFAERQTAGRGQRGNHWESASHKGIWCSILLRPKIEIQESPRLTAWAAQTVANTIKDQFSLPAAIKLPNDIYLVNRKVAGVLVEMRAQKKAPHIAIAGIGINVNQSPEDFSPRIRTRAVSLAIALDRQVDRAKLAVALLRNLDQTYREVFS